MNYWYTCCRTRVVARSGGAEAVDGGGGEVGPEREEKGAAIEFFAIDFVVYLLLMII
jgi:hypothetical protein